MDISKVEQAAPLLRQIEALQHLVADIQQAVDEHWNIAVMRASAPAKSTKGEGALLDLLPFGQASDDLSQMALATALEAYKTQLAALTAEMDAL